MKHSIRFIEVSYNPRGSGKRILILRGMEVREYAYTPQRFAWLIRSNVWGEWNDESFPNQITFTRKYPE
jgi:hypothetical protein